MCGAKLWYIGPSDEKIKQKIYDIHYHHGLSGCVAESLSLSPSSQEWRQADNRASVILVSWTISGFLLAPRGSDGQSRLYDSGAPAKGELVCTAIRLCSLRMERGTRPGRSWGVAGDTGDGSHVELSS
jgi:hypothetical protein